ncbi:NEAT domain-containing protein [Hathewaya histolytica]|uniref:NEAT domain-containing protein n=1 Tax=Hathewaya histolytica TaxID=1498 RepID=UPI003B6832AA
MNKSLSKRVAVLVILTNIATLGNTIISMPVYAQGSNIAKATVQNINKVKEKSGLYEVSVKTLQEKNDSPSMAGGYLEKVNYEIKDGKKFFIFSLDSIDWMKNISVSIDGKEVKPNLTDIVKKEASDGKGEQKGKIKFEVENFDSKLVLHMNVVPMGNARVGFRVVPEKDTLKLVKEYKEAVSKEIQNTKPVTKPEVQPNPNSEVKSGTNIQAVKEGLYELKGKALKEDSGEVSKSNSYLEKVEYEIKDGKQYLITNFTSFDIMKNIKVLVDGKDATTEIEKTDKGKKGKVKFEVADLDSKVKFKMTVNPLFFDMNVSFDLSLERDTVKLIKEYNGDKSDSNLSIEGNNKLENKPGESIKDESKNKIADGVYTVNFQAYKLDNPKDTSMLGGFFDKNVKLQVKDGKAKLTWLNICNANMLYDFRIESNGIFTESKATPKGEPSVSGDYAMQTFEMEISDLSIPHIGGVLVSAMGGQKSDIGKPDKYTKVKFVFDKNIESGWKGFEKDKEVKENDKILNAALIGNGLDKDKDGKVSEKELSEAQGTIDLSSSEISDISMLSKLGAGVTELHLNGNQIKELPKGVFDNLTGLKVLYLNGNRINKLPKGIFDKLKNLNTLGLSTNFISELPEGIFDNLDNLTEELSLGNNKITELPEHVFDNLGKLKSLGLSENSLKRLPNDVFNNLSSLKGLYIYENQIENIPTGIHNLKNLKSLYIDKNKIESIPKEVGELRMLTTLDLSKNYIKEIHPSIFKNLQSLSNMNLSDNQITSIPDNIYKDNPELSILDVSLNKITNIPDSYKKYIDENRERFYPQKLGANLRLTAKDGKINSNYDLSALDLLCWIRTPDTYNGEKIPKTVQDYKTYLKNRSVKDLLNEKGYDWTIKTELQKKNSSGKYITINSNSIEEELDTKYSYEDKNMKHGDEYRIIKSVYATNSTHKSYVFSEIATAIAIKEEKEPQVKPAEKKDKDGLYSVKFKVLKENSDEPSMASQYVKEANYEVKDGKKYLIVTLDKGEWLKNISAEVDGNEIVPEVKVIEKNEKTEVRFEIGGIDSKVYLHMNVVPMGNAKIGFRLAVQKDSLQEIKDNKTDGSGKENQKSEPKPGIKPDVKPQSKPDVKPQENKIKDGLYNVNFRTLKENSDEPSMAGQYVKEVNYEVKDGKKYLVVTIDRSDWMKNLRAKVDGKEVIPTVMDKSKNKNGEEVSRVKFEVAGLNSEVMLTMNVVPMGNSKVSFRIKPMENTLKLIKGYEELNNKSSKGKKDELEKDNLNMKELVNVDPLKLKETTKASENDKMIKKLPQTGLPINTGILGTLGLLMSGVGVSLKKKYVKGEKKDEE